MDSSTYNDTNLLDMVRKGIEVPDSCKARALKLCQERRKVFKGFTPQEAALALGSKWTAKKIRKLLRRDHIPGTKLGGNWYVEPGWVNQTKAKIEAQIELEKEDPHEF